ncbi:cbb3-type cytochrome oxidase assembly protein CcoS [Aurantivibrio infirmus]
MQSLYLLIPIVLIVVTIGVALFFWAVKSGQYEDLEKESQSIFFDDEDSTEKKIARDDHQGRASSNSSEIDDEEKIN